MNLRRNDSEDEVGHPGCGVRELVARIQTRHSRANVKGAKDFDFAGLRGISALPVAEMCAHLHSILRSQRGTTRRTLSA